MANPKPPEKGYGPYLEDLIFVLDREQMPENTEPAVGKRLTIQLPNGITVPVTIKDFSETTVTVDANHSLAGRDLIFEIELIEIV